MVILGLLCFFGVSAVVLLAYAVTAVVVTGMVIVTAPMWIAFVVAGVLEVWAVVVLGRLFWRMLHGGDVDLAKAIWKPAIMLMAGVIVFWVGVFAAATLVSAAVG